jgi:Acetamidase/Formamidase family
MLVINDCEHFVIAGGQKIPASWGVVVDRARLNLQVGIKALQDIAVHVNPQFSQWLAFSGTSVTLDNVQHYLDSHLSYQRACLHAIDYLSKFGYSRIQAYMILGSAPIEGRLSGVVDIPNSCSTVYIPTEIFDIDVRPSANGPAQIDPGMGVPMASAGARAAS